MTWREWWEEITGIGVGLDKTGAMAAQQYIDGAKAELERNKTLSALLGKEFDITGSLEEMRDKTEKIFFDLYNIPIEKIANGEVFQRG